MERIKESIKLERVASCPSCGARDSTFWSRAQDRLHRTSDASYAYRACLNCCSVFQSPRPVQSDIWKCYPANYAPHGKRDVSPTWSRLPRLMDRILNRIADVLVGGPAFRASLVQIEGLLATAGTMLDFGCGAGKYLDRARKLGCQCIGMDFSPQALEQVRLRGHTALPVDAGSWSALAANSIGFVRMNHVVEHLYDPADVLGKLHALIKPDGVLHIATPNPDGHAAHHYRESWFGLDCPRHIVLLPPDCLAAMLRKIGFDRVQVIADPYPKDLVRSWAYQRMDQGRMKSVPDVGSLLGDGLLNLAFSLKLALPGAHRRRPDRYHVIARKAA